MEKVQVGGGCGCVLCVQMVSPPSWTSAGWLGPKLGGPPCRNLVKLQMASFSDKTQPSSLWVPYHLLRCHLYLCSLYLMNMVVDNQVDKVVQRLEQPKSAKDKVK